MQTVRKILDEAPKKAQTLGGSATKGVDSGGSLVPGEAGGKVGEGAVENGGKEEVKSEGEATKDVPPLAESESALSNGVRDEAATMESIKPVTTEVDPDPATAADRTSPDQKAATGSEL